MRHVSRTHTVALDRLFDRLNLDPKIQIKYTDTRNQLADIPTKVNFTRDEWDHLLCLFNISHFSSTDCSEVMSKRTQKDSAEERITAKSRQMSIIARSPSTLSSSASESPGREAMKVRVPGVRKLRNMIELGNPLSAITQVTGQDTTTTNLLKARTQHATQGGTMTKLGRLKIGKLMN